MKNDLQIGHGANASLNTTTMASIYSEQNSQAKAKEITEAAAVRLSLKSSCSSLFQPMIQFISNLSQRIVRTIEPIFRSNEEKVDYTNIVYTTVGNMYGEEDLSSCPLFKGGYINFGFWKGIDISSQKLLTDSDRIASEESLYNETFIAAGLNNSDKILEVGSGLGFGCALASTKYKVKSITGMDLCPDQLARASDIHSNLLKNVNNIRFRQGSAEAMPMEDQAFSKVISVEAAQHFRNVPAFLAESHRVLAPNGKLIVSTFFATSESSIPQLKTKIPTIRDDIDKVVPIDYVVNNLKNLGFKDITYRSIGEEVWHGFDKWISQTELKDTWNKDWLVSYRANLVDYYIVTAVKK